MLNCLLIRARSLDRPLERSLLLIFRVPPCQGSDFCLIGTEANRFSLPHILPIILLKRREGIILSFKSELPEQLPIHVPMINKLIY